METSQQNTSAEVFMRLLGNAFSVVTTEIQVTHQIAKFDFIQIEHVGASKDTVKVKSLLQKAGRICK